MLAPVRPIVSAAGLKQGVELTVAGTGSGVCDPERRHDAWRHVGPPVRSFAAARIVGGQSFPAFEMPTVDSNAMNLEGFRLRLVLGHIGAD